MQIEQYAAIRGSLDEVFRYAADAAHWPALLPLYRSVSVLADDGRQRTLDVVALRDGIPVRWQAIQERFPAEGRITYRFLGGLARGLTAEWQLKGQSGWVHVRVVHDFALDWPVLGSFVADRISRFLVRSLCTQTLQGIKALVEHAAPDPPPAHDGRAVAADGPAGVPPGDSADPWTSAGGLWIAS
ncbi:MAG: SRPBCC family protein [Chloroflexi bacterium]|nr:SRPBCC family protein [Chloroflexota bacterium]